MDKLFVVIPAYNEEKNKKKLLMIGIKLLKNMEKMVQNFW